MTDKYKSMDPAVRDPKALQSIAGRPLRGYTHPIRCGSLNTPPKLREHASHAYPGSSEVTGDSGENKSKAKWQFIEKVYVISSCPVSVLWSHPSGSSLASLPISRTVLLIVVRKCLVTKKKTTAHDSSRPANYGKDHAQPAIGHSTGVDPSNPGMRLRHAKDSCHGFLPTPSNFNRPSTPSDDSGFRVSELEVNPRYLEGQVSTHSGSPPDDDEPSGHEGDPKILWQPETRPISYDQLVIEVKGIYAGLVMVESKCIDIDEKQSAAAQEKDPAKKTTLENEQWQSLIALHKQLLHEHHDFLLASQHPSASPALSKLASKYSMPARMWRHGIHAFLEILRHRLPEPLEHMLAFIYIAYEMLALLYETVPVFEATWIECLGNLTRDLLYL